MTAEAPDSQLAAARRRAVGQVLKQWRSQLIDVSGANRLLYYKDRKVATVDLAEASQSGVAELLAGKPIRARRLWPDPTALAAGVKSLKAIARPARVYAEEFGLQITYVASGFATWDDSEGRKAPCAPVLLRQVTFHAIPGSADGFELLAAEDVQVNPVLLHLLEADHNIRLDEADLVEASGGDEDVLFERLTKKCEGDLPGFVVEPRSVMANFVYASQAMVADLDDDNIEFLADHEMIAALAGDPDASDSVRAEGREVSSEEPDLCPPSDEHLILDADGSQSYVINAIVGGQHLVVQGPPGTGKTQTITNTVAELVARGKSVLFVAQKRAAITAVLDRLHKANLDSIVLDLFEGAGSRKKVVQELGTTLERASTAVRPRVDDLYGAYSDARGLLVSHRAAMHEIREPWGMSLLGSKDSEVGECTDGFYDWAVWTRDDSTDVRLEIAALRSWDETSHDQLRRQMNQLFEIGGLDRELMTKPGWSVDGLPSVDALTEAEGALERLGDVLADAREIVGSVVANIGVTPPVPLTASWSARLTSLLGRIADHHELGLNALLDPSGVSSEELDHYLVATGDKTYRSAQTDHLGLMARRRLRKQLGALLPPSGERDLHASLSAAKALRRDWSEFAATVLPDAVSPRWSTARTALVDLDVACEALSPAVQGIDLDDLEALPEVLNSLRADRRRRTLPRIHALRLGLIDGGCGPVLDDLAEHPANSGGSAQNRLSHAFAMTVIEHLDRTDQRLAGLTSADLNRATNELIAADEKMRDANASRVRRAAADRLMDAMNSYPAQAEAIRGQVKRKRGYMPIRRLVGEAAPDVILAAKPVWVASPQIVSQLLPARVVFDVVLFDEASQVLPSAALPSIARGRQVVVAGDDLQLPPTTVFTKTSELDADDSMNLDVLEPSDEEPEAEQGTTPPPSVAPVRRPLAEIPMTESILDAISVKLGTQRSRHLAWHYRSRDEKLIATSNTFLYRPRGRNMTTFPAADSAGALALVQCAPSLGLGKTNLSPVGEVHRVVDMMLAHAELQIGQDPQLSLGVIAFGAKHAARIERDFEERVASSSPEVRAYFDQDSVERYFIKNIERVQGDERDVILLSVGYAKGTDGRLRYNWGPVLAEGGHRRVNVAITRARHEMRLVTSFDPNDVDQSASSAEGFELMYRFLRFAASEGTDFGDEGAIHIPCNTFEADIQQRLEKCGLHVVPQWGVGGYRLDFAIRHPDEPGRFVLAVEADGASYHSGLVARERDRLRQRQLEARGWRFVRIWSSDYFFDPEPEIGRVVAAYEEELGKDGPRRRRTRAAANAVNAAREAATGDEVSVPDWHEVAVERGPRPPVPPGYPIGEYSDRNLRAMVEWIISDDLPRTKSDVYELVKRELGFMRDGKNIVARINAAVDSVIKQPRVGP